MECYDVIQPSINELLTYVGRQVSVTIHMNGGKTQRLYGTLDKYDNILSVRYKSVCENRFRPIYNVTTKKLIGPFEVFVEVELFGKDKTSSVKTQNKMLLLCEV